MESFVSQAFKSFSVQYEMKKKQTEPLLQPVHREGKLSVDQALVKQAWDRVSARVRAPIVHQTGCILIISQFAITPLPT